MLLAKVGSPTGNVVAKIWNAAGSVVYTSSTTVAASGLSTSPALINYDFSSNTRAMVVGDKIGVEYTGTSAGNYVVTYIREADIISGGNRSHYNADTGNWIQFTDAEMCCVMWE